MKNILLALCMLSLFWISGRSQSLSLSNASGPLAPNATIIQAGTTDSAELLTHIYVKNVSSNDMGVLCKKVEFSLLDSTEVSMCWAGQCFGAMTYVSPYDQSIPAGTTCTDFVGHYTQIAYSHFKSGESLVRWVFFDRANANDSVSVTVRYTTYGLGIAESDIHEGHISGAFPNPAGDFAAVNYSLKAGFQGSVSVRNILGEEISKIVLPAESGRITISTRGISNGIYFYSLLVNEKVLQTKKLIVRH